VQLLFLIALADIGPSTNITLIEKGEHTNNTRGNSMNLTYWVYTDGEGHAYINLNT
jgi:hypothetical protein